MKEVTKTYKIYEFNELDENLRERLLENQIGEVFNE